MKLSLFTFTLPLVGLFSSEVSAGVCDYRLSQLIGGKATTTIGVGGAVTSAGGLAFHAAGFYIITNATTGAAMIGSTAAGASGAGTVGIIGGTAGAAGTIGAVVSAPVTIAIGILTAVGVSAVEGGCYFADERITDQGQILSILERIDQDTDDKDFRLLKSAAEPAYIKINYDGTGMTRFEVRNLYIVNGELLNRDWFRNTHIGYIGAIVPQGSAK